MGSFMKKPVAEALSEELVSIISNSRRKDTMNRPGESRLADVVNGLVIPFVAV